eukprot:m.103286 g.103286  ORF g.103286 m.103286 type:complete len:58 (+) comp9090_c0_seq3:1088-1261(+)
MEKNKLEVSVNDDASTQLVGSKLHILDCAFHSNPSPGNLESNRDGICSCCIQEEKHL